MTEAFYERLEDGWYRATPHTNGPWAPGLQHAGPPAALLTRAVRALPGLPARLSFDIFAPVPVADLHVAVEVVRPGRKVALAQATLSHDDRPLMTLRAWLLRQSGELPVTPAAPAPSRRDVPAMERPAGWHRGYLDAIAWHWVEGSFEKPGPAAVWTRLLVDLVDGEPTDALDHLVLVADSASGISAVASPQELLFVNTDLTLHLTRMPAGDAIWMRAETVLDAAGVGRTSGALGDAGGQVASSEQCLFVERR